MDKFLEIRDFAKKSETVEDFMEGCGVTDLPDNDEDLKLYKEFHIDGRSEEQAAKMAVYEMTKNSCNCAHMIKLVGNPHSLTEYITKNYADNMAKLTAVNKSKSLCFCVSQMIKICSINRGAKCYFVSMNYSCNSADRKHFEIGCIPANEFWEFMWNLLKETESFDDVVESIAKYICSKIDWEKAENFLKLVG